MRDNDAEEMYRMWQRVTDILQDFDAEDCGMTEPGWISEYVCGNCQSEYDIFIPKSATDKIDEDGEHETD